MGNVNVVYKDLVEKVLKEGALKSDRTGTGTISTFGNQVEIDLKNGFPLLTTKRVYWKAIVVETIMFLKGITDLKFLLDHNVDIWTRDAWKFYLKNKQYRDNYFFGKPDMDLDEFREYAKEHGFDMGEIYGSQWVDFGNLGIVNQLEQLEYNLKNNPDSRRMKVYSANPSKVDNQTLPPCHDAWQVYVQNKMLSLLFQMRSSDLFHGWCFNVASYGFIAYVLAFRHDLEVDKLVAQLGDTHIYTTHLEAVNEQLQREPLPLPTLILNERIKSYKSISDIQIEDIELINYNPHPTIKAPQAF